MDRLAEKEVAVDREEFQHLETPIARSNGISPGQSNEERRLLQKLDVALVAMLSGCFFFAYLDRGNIGNARIMGFQEAAHLSNEQFFNCLMVFFVGYMVVELPAILSLRVIPPNYVFGFAVMLFGVFSTCFSQSKSYATVILLRLLIGIAEAFVQCGFVFLSLWYRKEELSTRTAFFYLLTPIAGAFSGLIAYGSQKNLNGSLGYKSWQWLFIIEGIISVGWGLLVLLVLPRNPETVAKNGSWLFRGERERELILERTKTRNDPNARPRLWQVWWGIKDIKVWLAALAIGANCVDVAAFTSFIPTFIHLFGFSPVNTQLYSMIPYACATFTMPVVAIISDRLQKRAIPLLCCFSVSLLGFMLLLATTDRSTLLAGCSLVAAGSYPGVVLSVNFLLLNQAGYSKKASSWMIAQIFCQCWSIVSTQVYTDPPRYFKGHGTLIGLNVVGMLAVAIKYWIIKRENARRDAAAAFYAAEGCAIPDSEKSLEDLCDYHPTWRYVL